jgi:ubiquinone/menaquinone biosynthesis C-methylase UbiE
MHEAVWTREQAVALLDDPSRRQREDPRELWSAAGLRRGMCVVDVGAGSGYYAFPASAVVGAAGRVYAVDVSRDLVLLLNERARKRRRKNFHALASRAQQIPLPSGTADRVLLANVLHGIPPSTVREAVRVLRPGGRLVNVDWKKYATPRGPPVARRLSAAAARRTLERYGLRTVREWEFGPNHYAVMLEKAVGARGAATEQRPRAP